MLKNNKNSRIFLPFISPLTSRSDNQSYSQQKRCQTEEDTSTVDYQLPTLNQRSQFGWLSKKNYEVIDSCNQNIAQAQSTSKLRVNKFFIKGLDLNEDNNIDIGSPETLIRENNNKTRKTSLFQNNLMDEFLNDEYYKNAMDRNKLKSQRKKQQQPKNIEQKITVNDRSEEYLLSSKITENQKVHKRYTDKIYQQGDKKKQAKLNNVILDKDNDIEKPALKKSLSRISEQTSFSFLSSRNQSINQTYSNIRRSTKTQQISFKIHPRFSDKYKQPEQQRKSVVYESKLTPIQENFRAQDSYYEKKRVSVKNILEDFDDGGNSDSKVIEKLEQVIKYEVTKQKMVEQTNQQIKENQQNDDIKSNSISETSSEDSEYDVWDNQEVEDRGLELEKLGRKFNKTEQFLLLYKIRYGMFPTQRETIDNEQVIQYAQEMTLGDRKVYLKYFGNPQKIQFEDQNDYSIPVKSQDSSPKYKPRYSSIKTKIQNPSKYEDEDKRSTEGRFVKDQDKLTSSTLEQGNMKSSQESEDFQLKRTNQSPNRFVKNTYSQENEKRYQQGPRALKPKLITIKSQLSRPINAKYQKSYIETCKI